MKFSRCVSRKRKIPPMQHSDGFCRVKQRQNESGVLRGGTFFLGSHPLKVVVITVRTTTFVGRIWNKGYHGSMGASRWFCRIYCGKAVEVRLIIATCFLMFRKYRWFAYHGWGILFAVPPSFVIKLTLLFQRVISKKQSQSKKGAQYIGYSLCHDDTVVGE